MANLFSARIAMLRATERCFLSIPISSQSRRQRALRLRHQNRV